MWTNRIDSLNVMNVLGTWPTRMASDTEHFMRSRTASI